MNTSALKNQTKTVDYEKNLRRLLGSESLDNKILRKSAGILKGTLRQSALAYQREIRKEWENRVKKLEKQIRK